MAVKNTKNKSKEKPVQEIMSEEDLMFLKLALPRNVIRDSWNLRVNEVYRTFVVAYEYPNYIEDLLYARLCDMPGVTITIDLTPVERTKARKNISDSMDELSTRQGIAQSEADYNENYYEYEDLRDLHKTITRANEHIISHTLRFLVTASSQEELKEKVKDVREQLEQQGIKSYVPVNEMLSEYKNLVSPSDTVKQDLPVYSTLARQFPFHHEAHADPHGTYFGYTNSGGLVFFDPTIKQGTRSSYDLFLSGMKGSGKTATLKSMGQDLVACGHRMFILDVEGEYDGLVKNLNGRVVSPFREDGRINILELPPVADEEETNYMSVFAVGISRVETFFYQYVPELTVKEAVELKTCLLITYQRFGITENTDLRALKHNQWPTMSDLLATIRDQLYVKIDNNNANNTMRETRPSLSENKKTVLENIETYVRALSKEDITGQLFDTHTTIDVANENLVVVDLTLLSDMESRTYNAVVYMTLSMIWQEYQTNRAYNRAGRNSDNSEFFERFIFTCISEAHRFVNTSNPKGLDFVEKVVRRARKYWGGIWFDSQNPRDLMPESSGGERGVELEQMKAIFQLVQYKAILQQDPSSIAVLKELFPVFTESELLTTASFVPGQMLLFIGNGVKLRCHKYIPDEDLKAFQGGRE